MENGRLGCFAGETMENTVKLCKTIQNHGKLKKGVWVFLFITTIKKKKIKKQLLVADGGIIENKVLFSYVWLLGVICGYVWFLLFWCAFLWGVGLLLWAVFWLWAGRKRGFTVVFIVFRIKEKSTTISRRLSFATKKFRNSNPHRQELSGCLHSALSARQEFCFCPRGSY